MARNMINNNSFRGKVALMTGGTSGIGKATAITFARAAKVVLSGPREIHQRNQTKARFAEQQKF
jgi:NAD(P)-dependent dehydrogenase (short-subunit alcohol dehydrogenase family)